MRKHKEEKGKIFPQFFQIKAGNFITGGTYFTQSITRLIHLQHPPLKSSCICSGISFFYFSLIGPAEAMQNTHTNIHPRTQALKCNRSCPLLLLRLSLTFFNSNTVYNRRQRHNFPRVLMGDQPQCSRNLNCPPKSCGELSQVSPHKCSSTKLHTHNLTHTHTISS